MQPGWDQRYLQAEASHALHLHFRAVLPCLKYLCSHLAAVLILHLELQQTCMQQLPRTTAGSWIFNHLHQPQQPAIQSCRAGAVACWELACLPCLAAG